MQRLCIYCGSSAGSNERYVDAARQLARKLAEKNIGVVYGGARVGIMGAVADAALAGGAEVIGVIPESLTRKELMHDGLTALHVVASMHERKAQMAELSDGFVALPGGFGTLEEIVEVITWAQLGFHRKPCGFLNVDGYFDAFFRFVDHAVGEGFIRTAHRNMIVCETSPESLLERFANYEAPDLPKWIDKI